MAAAPDVITVFLFSTIHSSNLIQKIKTILVYYWNFAKTPVLISYSIKVLVRGKGVQLITTNF